MKKLCILIFFIFIQTFLSGQVHLITDEVSEGYTLYQGGNRAYLVNNCGEEVNRWNNVNPNYHAKLLEDGNLIYIQSYDDAVVIKDWENNIVSTTELQENQMSLEYEVIVLPNGNFLCVGRKYYELHEIEAIGYDTDSDQPFQFDVIIELDKETGETVWLWEITDHVIQERDSTKLNFGSVKDNPQLFDMDAISNYDWTNSESFMINGMDYNAELDQIIISVRKMGEIVIIDHSTTITEAAKSVGGLAGMGGDILYRWGNPQNYGRGTEDDHYLFYQHNPNWIEDGPDKGKLTFYNNGLGRPGSTYWDGYSTVGIIDPPLDGYNYNLEDEIPFGPVEPEIDISEVTTGTQFYSGYTSASRVLPNGNFMITIGAEGRVIEVNRTGEIVWDYTMVDAGFIFRSEKYLPDYPGLDGKDLTPQGTINNMPNNVPCSIQTFTQDLLEEFVEVYYDPTSSLLNITNPESSDLTVFIYSAQGTLVKQKKNKSAIQFDMGDLAKGVYFTQIVDGSNARAQVEKVFVN